MRRHREPGKRMKNTSDGRTGYHEMNGDKWKSSHQR